MILLSSPTETFEAAGCQKLISYQYFVYFLYGCESWSTTLTEDFKRTSAKTKSSGNYSRRTKTEIGAFKCYTKLTLLRREKQFKRHPVFSDNCNPMDT